MRHNHPHTLVTTVLVMFSLLPSAVCADEHPPPKKKPLVDAAALTARYADAHLAQRGRRRRGSVRSTGSRRSLGRIFTGASIAVGGALVARTAHTRIGEIDARNGVRDEWNAAAARFEEANAAFDRECSTFSTYFTDYCLELRFEVAPALLGTMTTLAENFPFLPQIPDVGTFITSDEEERIYAWLTTPSTLESTRRWNTTFYSGLAAAGVGGLLATIWSDVPVVRNLRVHPAPTRMTVQTTVGW